MYDIKKFAKTGVQTLDEGIGLAEDGQRSILSSSRGGAATAMLLDSKYSVKEELLSSIS